MDKHKNKQKGDLGEKIATGYLVNHGYKIIKRNFRCNAGEIDIVCKKDDTLIFVEVKAKTTEFFGSPEEMVDWRKMEKIGEAIEFFITTSHYKEEPNYRIDVIAMVLGDDGKIKRFNHIENFGG